MKKPQIQTTIFIVLGNSALPVYLNALSLLKNAICGPLSYFRMAFEYSLGSIEYATTTKNNSWTWNKKNTECLKTYEYPDPEQLHISFIKAKYLSEGNKKDLVSPTPTL